MKTAWVTCCPPYACFVVIVFGCVFHSRKIATPCLTASLAMTAVSFRQPETQLNARSDIKNLANMLAVIANILFYLRIFNYIVAHKCGQGLHTDKLHCLMQRQIYAINADTAEKLVFIGESG